MKKFLLVAGAIIAGLILLGSIGPLIGLVICLAILYFSIRQFVKANEKGSKILWGIIGTIAILAAITNAPAIIGIAAIIALYFIYKNWDKEKNTPTMDNDPFTNFEKEWNELNKKML